MTYPTHEQLQKHTYTANVQGSKASGSEAAAARQRWQDHNQNSGQQWVRSARCVFICTGHDGDTYMTASA